MATKMTSFSVNANTENMKENMRKLISFTNKKLYAYKSVGEMDGEQTGKEYIADYNVPTLTTSDDLNGVINDTAVQTKVEDADQVVNYMTRTVFDTKVNFAAANNNAVGNLGDISAQEEQLLLRFMEIVDTALKSNKAAVKYTDSVAGTAGGPLTYAHRDNVINAGTGAATTIVAAGYNSTNKTTTAIDDNVSTRGSISFADISAAARTIFEAHNGADGTMSTEPTLTEEAFTAHLPSNVYDGIFVTNATSVESLNRFNTNIGGEKVTIQNHVMAIRTKWGLITLFPAVNQVGDNDTVNKFGVVFGNNATEVIYDKRPVIHKLADSQTDDHSAIRASWTMRGPQERSVAVIAGVTQD